jgi:ribonuclease T2
MMKALRLALACAIAVWAALRFGAAPSSSAGDWNLDPAADWRSSLPAAPKVPEAAPAPAAQGGGASAGQFDSYTFSLEWLPEFCATQHGDECASLSAGQWAAKNLSLHGMWPDKANDPSHSYSYCGVPSSVRSLDHKDSWCQMPSPGISAGTMNGLSGVMPGTTSCLQNHEWYKHGSCSGMAADAYFAEAAALTAKFSTTAPGRFITANVGKTVNAEDLLAAFESEFGAGSRKFASLRCGNSGGQTLFAEIRLALSPKLGSPDELGRMLLPSGGGNCPASFVINLPGR